MPIKMKALYGYDTSGMKHAFYWAASRQKRNEVLQVKRGDPAAFEAVYQGRPGQREGSIFLEADFNYYEPPMFLEQGVINPIVREFCVKGYGVFQAWDTSFDETKESAYSVCVTGLYVPCNKFHRNEDPLIWGVCESHFDVLILEVFREKLDWGGLTMAFRTQRNKWNPDLVIIEKRASGISLFQAMQSAGVPILGVGTDVSKKARATEGVGAGSAQGWFRLHRVLFPLGKPSWLDAYTAELKDFSGADDAPSDQVDATVHLLRHAIMAGVNAALLPSEWSPDRGDPYDQAQLAEYGTQMLATDERTVLLTFFGEAESLSTDIFAGLCGRCAYHDANRFCSVHKAQKIALDTCGAFTNRAN
jgi:phage terminase large subunit-like protein